MKFFTEEEALTVVERYIQGESPYVQPCNHEKRILCCIKQTNGVNAYKKICLRCGKSGNAIAYKKLSDKEKESAHKTTSEKLWKWKSIVHKEYSQELKRIITPEVHLIRNNLWHHWYNNEYLVSYEWREKRNRILGRDEYTCIICRKKADCVHHVTYARVQRYNAHEFDDDLISLCHGCHERIHRGEIVYDPYAM